MTVNSLKTPVVLLVFNRPDCTQQLFEKIAEVQPSRLYVVADAPRHEQEVEKCLAVREIVENVTWDCDAQYNYAEENMGLKARISSGLNWVFEQEETAIILEDDCIPDLSFFRFCEDLLQYYKDDERIMHISGDNFGHSQGNSESYYFSKYAHVWGWATWRRAWQKFDLDMTFWDTQAKRNTFLENFPNHRMRRYWEKIFNRVYEGDIGSWAYPWMASCIYHHGLCVMPYKNLVRNIGFGIDATHTGDSESHFINRPTSTIEFPLRHPKIQKASIIGDTLTDKLLLQKKPFIKRVKAVLLRFKNRLYQVG